MPLTRILIRTWFGPGSGVGTSLSTQALFAEGTIAAFIPRLLFFGNSKKNELSSVLFGAGRSAAHHATGPADEKNPPLGPSAGSSARRMASAAPSSTVCVPRLLPVLAPVTRAIRSVVLESTPGICVLLVLVHDR